MSSTGTEQRSPWTRPGFIASAGVVGLVAILGVTFGVSALRDDNASTAADPTEPTTSRAASAAPSTAPAVDEGDASICGLEGIEMSGTLTTPPTVDWALVGTTATPSSPSAGPGVIDDATGARYCFQHTPEGALLAAATFIGLGENPLTQAVAGEHLVADGPGRDAYLARVTDPNGTTSATRLQIAGFNVLSYDGRAATIDLAFETSSNAVGAVAMPMTWEDGDWKVQLADNGQIVNAPVQLPDLTGYVPWSGV